MSKLSNSLKTSKKSRNLFDFLSKMENIAAVLTFFVVVLIIVIIVSPSFYLKKMSYTLNKPIAETVRSPFTFDVIDTSESDKLKDQAEDSVKRIYQYNKLVEEDALKKIDLLFSFTTKYNSDKTIEIDDKILMLKKDVLDELGFDLSVDTATNLLQRANWLRFQSDIKNIITYILSERGVISNKERFITLFKNEKIDLVDEKNNLITEVKFNSDSTLEYPAEIEPFLNKYIAETYYTDKSEWNTDTVKNAVEICMLFIRPNLSYLEHETETIRQQHSKEIKDIVKVYKQGSVIIDQGNIVTNDVKQALDRRNTKIITYNLLNLVCTAIFVAAFAFFITIYIKRFEQGLSFTAPNIILVGLPIIMTLFIGRCLLMIPKIEVDYAGYLFPAGLIGMLTVILVSPRLAFISTACGCFLFGLSTEMEFKYIIIAFCGGFTATALLYSIKQRTDILKAGFITSIVNFLLTLAINYIDDPSHLKYDYAFCAMLNGIFCYIFTVSSLVLFEYMFGVTTDVRLLELTGIHQPLLNELEEKIPGSFQHSLNVAKLAESAADDVGANYLLTRAGAFYHDIGKISKPKYFTENQLSQEEKSLHSKLTPNMSTLIIKNHVKYGIELANKYNLPQKVIDFIPQHHGTTLIKFFYQAALEQSANSANPEVIKEDDFRYAGPNPQSVETAIVMLADAVEATSTLIFNKPYITEDEIQKLVHNIITDKFNDGQLDECSLTLKQLHTIKQSFVDTLRSKYHQRIAYPSKEKIMRTIDMIGEKSE